MSLAKKTRTQKNHIISEVHEHNILLDSREIFVHAYIDSEDDSGVEYRMANIFLKNIKILESMGSGPIVIHQHNWGGNYYDGMLMYDAIAGSSCPIIFLCHGIAASIGSIIPQAVLKNEYGGIRLCMPNCCWLIHDGYTGVNPGLTHKQSQSWNAFEKELRKVMINIYIETCKNGSRFEGLSEKRLETELQKKLDVKEDWWLNAEEAVEYGFVNGIFGTEDYPDLETIKGQI